MDSLRSCYECGCVFDTETVNYESRVIDTIDEPVGETSHFTNIVETCYVCPACRSLIGTGFTKQYAQ